MAKLSKTSNKVNEKCAKKIKEGSGDGFLRLLPVNKLTTADNVERRPISGKIVGIVVMVVTECFQRWYQP